MSFVFLFLLALSLTSPEGYSLWLVPPQDHLQHQLLSTLIIEEIPKLFNIPTASEESEPPVFSPHVTLTSAIPKDVVGDDPKAWLEELKLPGKSDVEVRWTGLDKGNTFFKKLFFRYGASFLSLKEYSAYQSAQSREIWVV